MTIADREPLTCAEQAGEWCRRIAEGCLASDEIAAFETWMASDPEHRAAFDRATFIWKALDGQAAAPQFLDVRLDALAALHNRAGPVAAWRRWAWPAAVAAALVLVLVSSLLFASRPDIYQTRLGERRMVILDDGSRISLDAATKVAVRYSDEHRDLKLLAGRAKFDVAHDPLRPFSVTAGNKIVVATGTSFSVELLRRDVQVVLYEGHVAVLGSRAGTKPRPIETQGHRTVEQQLRPGAELTLGIGSNDVARIASIDPGRTLTWEAGHLSFDDEPLGLAVERMNRYARIPIELGDPRAAAIPISGVFDTDNCDGFIAGVTGVFPVKAERTGQAIVLTSAPR